MGRTLDPVGHAVRRDAFVDVAQRLVQARGYEQMSVQDVLVEAGASRGAFYHYFDGKAALLDAVIDRMVDDAWKMLDALVAEPDLRGLDKLRSVFTGLADFKAERRDLVLGIITVWRSDDNAIVREKFRRATTARLVPLLARIIRQGNAEGDFAVADPDAVAGVLVALILGANEAALELYVAREAGTVTFDEVQRRLSTFGSAFEQILGLPPGQTALADPAVLRQWFV